MIHRQEYRIKILTFLGALTEARYIQGPDLGFHKGDMNVCILSMHVIIPLDQIQSWLDMTLSQISLPLKPTFKVFIFNSMLYV